jgi:hypothetical protein
MGAATTPSPPRDEELFESRLRELRDFSRGLILQQSAVALFLIGALVITSLAVSSRWMDRESNLICRHLAQSE